jgi:hypothetical protein
MYLWNGTYSPQARIPLNYKMYFLRYYCTAPGIIDQQFLLVDQLVLPDFVK